MRTACQRWITRCVILSEQSESKDLRTDLTAGLDEMRRFLDALRLLGMAREASTPHTEKERVAPLFFL